MFDFIETLLSEVKLCEFVWPQVSDCQKKLKGSRNKDYPSLGAVLFILAMTASQ